MLVMESIEDLKSRTCLASVCYPAVVPVGVVAYTHLLYSIIRGNQARDRRHDNNATYQSPQGIALTIDVDDRN